MALRAFDFEISPAGTTLTTTNVTGASQITANTGTAQSSTVFVKNGTYGARFVSGAAALCIARITPLSSSTTMSFGYPFSIDAAPATSGTPTWVATLRNSGGAAMRVQWTYQNTLEILDATGANPATLGTGLTPGAGYWVSIGAIVATSTTGYYIARLYDNTGVLINFVTSSTYNIGTTAITAADIGVVNSNPAAGTAVNVDYVQFNNGSSQGIAPPAAVWSVSGSSAATGAATATSTVTFTQTATTAATGTVTVATNAAFGTVTASNATGATSGSTTYAASVSGGSASTGNAVAAASATFGISGGKTATGTSSATTTAVLSLSATETGSGFSQTTTQAVFGTKATIVGIGTITAVQTKPQRDITVTATLGARRWAGQTVARNKQGTIGTRRWGGRIG